MVRNALSVFVGAVVWLVGFLTLVFVLAMSWPNYQAHVRTWIQAGVFTFTSLMAWLNLFFWVTAALAAGWVAATIAKQRAAVWVLAALLELCVFAVHIVVDWPRFPWWYNLGVVVPCAPAILLGSGLAAHFRTANTGAEN